MKKVLGLLALVLAFNGCDDGNLTQETINFETVSTQSCTQNNIIYKINDKEVLILEVPKTYFTTEPTNSNPITLNISKSTNRVVYRTYKETITADNICETIQPSSTIIDEWIGTSGTIQITTTAIKTTNSTDNSTKITGYNHNITLKNVTFLVKNGELTFETLAFGDYIINSTPLAFNFDSVITKCSTSNQIYKYKTNEALELDIDPSLLSNEVTPTNTPRKGLISASTNKLTYRLFSGLLSTSYFCNITPPTTPTISQEWIAENGVTDVKGIIEVTTTTNGPNSFKHTIVFKKVTFIKGNNNFTIGDSYEFGELITTN